MILKLKNKIVGIEQMRFPELLNNTYIKYVFEKNTEHLHPVLTLNSFSYRGNNIFINIPEGSFEGSVTIKVELFDEHNKIIKIYENNLEYNRYQITGKKPVRPDVEKYIFDLQNEIERLNIEMLAEKTRLEKIIEDLKDQGEIV
jgi:hypothetical protein